jgi:hypothetical protein
MNIKTIILLLALVHLVRVTLGQGTMLFTFDGPPVQPPGTSFTVTNYYEAGMSFTPVPGSTSFSRVGASINPQVPDDGTAFIRAALGQSLAFSFTNGSSFDPVSVDLAGYSSVVPDATIQFIGYRADGSTVTTSVQRHGIMFETYFFGPEFSDVTRVEIPNFGWSLDNLVVSVPEPGALSLWLIGFGCVAAKLRKRSNTYLARPNGQSG